MTIFKLIKFAYRNVTRNMRRTLITLCVAAFGFAAIAIVAGYFEQTILGLQELTIRNGFTGNGGTGHFQICNEDALQNEETYPLEFGIENYETIIKDVREIDRVSLAMPRIELSGLVSNGDKSVSFLGMGVNADKEGELIQILVDNSMAGLENSSYFKLQNTPNGVLLGKDMAGSLQAEIGSSLMLLSTTVDGAINAVDVTVAGIISTGLKSVDSYYLLTHLSTIQGLLQTDKVGKIVVALHETQETKQVKPLLSETIKRNSTLHTLSMLEWMDLAEYYHSIRNVYYIIFCFLGTVVIAIVGLSCTNTMLMATMERIKEIGTLRAIGISSKWIWFVFVFEGFLIGLGGIITGILLKFIATFIINHMAIKMPPPPGMTNAYVLKILPAIEVYPWIALLIIASTTLSSFVMLWKVKRISIVDALLHV